MMTSSITIWHNSHHEESQVEVGNHDKLLKQIVWQPAKIMLFGNLLYARLRNNKYIAWQ